MDATPMDAEVAKIVRRFAHTLRVAEHIGHAEPDNAAAQHAVGAAFSLAQDYARALRHFEQAAALAPTNAECRYSLGNARQAIGDAAGAETAFREALALAPSMSKAHYALAQISRQTAENNRIEALKQHFQAPDADGLNRLFIGHALAKSYEDMGQPKTAFDWLQKAKSKRRRVRPYSFAADLAVSRAAVAAAEKARAEGCPSEEPIFVVGLPRTGTTLVDRILSSHPEVISVGELSNFPQLMKAMTRTPSPLALDTPTLEQTANLDLARLGQYYMESTRPLTGKTSRFVDKAPINYLLAGLIHRALPRARIICLKRHPLDTCLSLYRQLFPTDKPYYDYVYDLADTARAYSNFHAVAESWRGLLPAQAYLEVNYEDIVADLEGQTRRMLAFCGLDWDERCLAFHENRSAVVTPSANQVRQPLYRSAVGRWRGYGDLLAPARQVLERAGAPLE